SDPAAAERLGAFQKIARVDVSKLAETILSCGGVPYNGTDLEDRDFNLGTEDDEMLISVRDREQAFYEQVAAEGDVKHHIRTQAILNKVGSNSKARLNFLNEVIKRLPGPVAARG
ncbi:MAG TPA: hypothetical protein VFG50_10760, partial [Rhodothermales bacterium]|nr:hypothetical protein [Rhodothermales bacterium]